MPQHMDAVTSRAKASLATAGLTVVGEDLDRPWGGFLLISQVDLPQFIRAYFPDAGLQDVGEQLALSPKLLLVAPGQRLSWQYHRKRSELWRIVEGPVGISRSPSDDEPAMHTYEAGEILRLELGERHRLVGLDTWGVIAEIWQHTDPASPSDELDIVRVADDCVLPPTSTSSTAQAPPAVHSDRSAVSYGMYCIDLTSNSPGYSSSMIALSLTSRARRHPLMR
jgi:mannose-6-phosphate isomerase